MRKYNELLQNIFDVHGCKHQIKKLNEESFELIEALLEYEATPTPTIEYRQHIIEEIADVLVLINQFKLKFDIPDGSVKDIMKEKIVRQCIRDGIDVEENLCQKTILNK